MRKSRFSEEPIVGILREHAAGENTGRLRRRHGISQQTLYRWKQKYDGLDGQDLQPLKALEEENARLSPHHPSKQPWNAGGGLSTNAGLRRSRNSGATQILSTRSAPNAHHRGG